MATQTRSVCTLACRQLHHVCADCRTPIVLGPLAGNMTPDCCETCGMEHLPPMESPYHEVTATVKRADLWGNVTDTHQTEAELNGFRASQGALL